MGLSNLYGTDLYNWVSTNIPAKFEIIWHDYLPEYELHIKPKHMHMLGAMCDYGIKARHLHRDFAYHEIGMAMSHEDVRIRNLINKNYLSPRDSQILYKYRPGREVARQYMNRDLFTDYVWLVERGIQLYSLLKQEDSYFGKYYCDDGAVQNFECDCVGRDAIFDTKVSATDGYTEQYWTQVLLYSLLAYQVEGTRRPRIGLVYPTQGTVAEFTYPANQYAILSRLFKQKYREVK